jgi:hypothetical protein
VCRAPPTLAVSVRASYPHRLGDGSNLGPYVTLLAHSIKPLDRELYFRTMDPRIAAFVRSVKPISGACPV